MQLKYKVMFVVYDEATNKAIIKPEIIQEASTSKSTNCTNYSIGQAKQIEIIQ